MGRPPNWTRFSRNSKGASPHAVREAAGSMTHKRAIIISAEFASFVGRGALDPAWLPPEPIVIGFGDMGEPAVSILASENIDDEAAGHILLFAISRPACPRTFGMRSDERRVGKGGVTTGRYR